MSGYGSILFEQHQEKLRSCAIDPEVAAARGYRTADTQRVLERYHFSRSQRRVPALLIPVWGVDGNVVLHQARPDEPRMNSKGKPIKYETPGGSRMALDVHPRTRTVLGDPKVPLVITEGVLKADSLLSHGQHALGLLGVWNWRGTNSDGGKTVLADFESVALNDRVVYIAFDSDATVKPQVQGALERLKAVLEQRGSTVRVCRLGASDKAKVGVDDYLAGGGSLQELLATADPELRPVRAHQPDEPDNRTDGPQPPLSSQEDCPDTDRTTAGQTPALALERDILALFVGDLRRAGVAGETRLAKLIYLATTSRLLDWGKATNRPVSVLIRGTTSTGKSHTLGTALKFFPAEASVGLGSMSKRFLFYDKESYAHRVLVIPEMAQVIDDDELMALLRTLLSEGRVIHGTVTGEGKPTPQRIVKEGPTALLTSTTKAYLDEELETRMLSPRTDDTPEQTRAVYDVYAELEEGEHDAVDLDPWHELQAWLQEHGENRVYVPFVPALAETFPTGSTRLRRDFVSTLCLVRANAILHQATRERDETGRIVATVEDYAVVRDLISELVAEAVEAGVSAAVRETVEAVHSLLEAGEDHATPKQVEGVLEVGRSATYERIHNALKGGWLVDDAKKDERGMRLKIGSPLPGDAEYLPTVAEIVRMSSGAHPNNTNAQGSAGSKGLSGSSASSAGLWESEEADGLTGDCDIADTRRRDVLTPGQEVTDGCFLDEALTDPSFFQGLIDDGIVERPPDVPCDEHGATTVESRQHELSYSACGRERAGDGPS